MRERKQIKLKYLCSSFSTTLATKELSEQGAYPVYGAAGIMGYLDSYQSELEYLGIIKDGAGVGRIQKYPEKSSLLGTMATIIPKSGVEIDWLKYAIIGLNLGESVDKTTIPHIYFSVYGNYYIWNIPKENQIKISAYLDCKCAQIDALIANQEQQIEKLKAYKQSLITETVTRGLNPDAQMKDSGVEWIGEIPEAWKIAKIKIGVSKVGSGKTPSGGAETYATEGILFLRSQNIYDSGLNLESPTYITEEIDEEMKNTRVHPNDVLLNITGGSIGRCCIFPAELKRANVNQHVSIIRVIDTIFIPEYIHYYWNSNLGKLAIALYQTGGNREGMSADAIKNSPIIVMPIKEQQQIADYLDKKCTQIDRLIAIKQQKTEKLRQYKKSLIYEYVTGKREVQAWI